jgi:intracellular sulfur oxidation DsrE/DsrF family protein
MRTHSTGARRPRPLSPLRMLRSPIPAPRGAARPRHGLGALAVALVALTAPAALVAQRPDVAGFTRSGPVIESTGPTVKVEHPTFDLPARHVFKAVYEINRGDTAMVSEQLTTVARFINLHVRHGIAKERVQAAAVFHGSGWMALLSDSAYGARFNGKPNPSRRLVEELLAYGVPLVLCGQTAGMRGVRREELLPGVQVAISAMSAMNVFQTQGFQLNPW